LLAWSEILSTLFVIGGLIGGEKARRFLFLKRRPQQRNGNNVIILQLHQSQFFMIILKELCNCHAILPHFRNISLYQWGLKNDDEVCSSKTK